MHHKARQSDNHVNFGRNCSDRYVLFCGILLLFVQFLIHFTALNQELSMPELTLASYWLILEFLNQN